MKKWMLVSSFITAMYCNIAAAQTLERVIEVGTGTNDANPYGFTVAANKLFFVALEGGPSVGLYVTEGTAASTKRISPSNVALSNISNLVAFDGKLFFSCDDGVHGKELWTSDGTASGTALFADLYPGAIGSSPAALTVAGNNLFMQARTAAGTGRLFVSDGGSGSPVLIRDETCYMFTGATRFPVLNNEVYFSGQNNIGIWKSNGTIQGTVLLSPSVTGVFSDNKYAVLGGKMYFLGGDNIYGGEPYVTDGTEAGTRMIKNIAPDEEFIKYSSVARGFTVFNNTVYFAANDRTLGEELYATDGTAAGTYLVKDLTPGSASSSPAYLMEFDGSLYISCRQSKELWKSNGTATGTVFVSTLNDWWRFGAVWNNQLYAIPGTLNGYLYKTGGTEATTGVATAENAFASILNYNTDDYLTVYNGSLYFGGSCSGIANYRAPLKLTATAVTRSFSFAGTGNWSDVANWAGGIVPPSTLQAGDTVVIAGNCILDTPVSASAGAIFTISAGGNLRLSGALTIQ